MKTCSHCGVRVERDLERCPLCYARLNGASGGEPGEESEREGEAIYTRPVVFLIEILSLLGGVAALVVFAADFAVGFTLSWSRFPLSAIVYAWVVTVAIIVLGRRAVLLWPALTAATLAFLLSLNLFAGGGPWFPSLALPMVVLAAVLIGAVIAAARGRGFSAPAVLSLSLGVAGVYAVGLELILGFYFGTPGRLSWSIVVLASAIALSLVLLFVHTRLRRRNASFERVFHL